MMTPKTPCTNCEAMRHREWCRKICTLAAKSTSLPPAARAKKELLKALPEDDGSIDEAKAQEILRTNAMRSPENQLRNPRPIRITTVDRIYPSVAQAARIASELTTRHIKDCEVVNVCMGRNKTLYGLKCEYVRLEVDG